MARGRFSLAWGMRRDRKATRGTAAGGSGGATPAAILGSLLHADFDAADPGIVLNGGNVSSIPNRGTDSAAMVQATATAQPLYSAAGFAGGPGMVFDGVDDTMLCTFATPIPSGRRPYMWLVCQASNTAPTVQIAVSLYNAASNALLVWWLNRSDVQGFSGQLDPGGPVGGGLVTVAPTAAGVPHLFEIGYTVGGTAALVFDGSASNAPSANAAALVSTLPKLRLGAHGDSAFAPGAGTIRRIIVANDLPSAAQIAAMRAYLRAQPYGLP